MTQNRLIKFFLSGSLRAKIVKIFGGAAALIGGIASAFGLYKEWKGAEITEISGYVSESKESLIPVDAIVRISSPVIYATDTDQEGKYVFKLKDINSDTFLFVIQDKKSKLETKEKHFISTKKGKYSFNIVFNPAINDGKEYSKTKDNVVPAPRHYKPKKSVNPEQTSVKATEVIHHAEKADFAVITTINGKQDGPMSGKLIAWLQKKGKGSQSILQNLFIQQNYFNEIFDGNSSVIRKTNAAGSVRYVCLARIKTDYSKSQIDELLTLAKCYYEILIIDADSGKVMDGFEHTEKASDISEEAALRRADAGFFIFLNERNIQL